MDDVITLVKVETVKDKYGITTTQETSAQDVFCAIKSVSRAEWFEGARTGLNPQYCFTIHAAEYDQEHIVRYNGINYSVYRTFLVDPDHLELYVEYKKGTS
jgi:SPP1 family predicted phage head-tail adaptor